MELTEILLIGIRWLHSMAAIVWIGAAFVYLGVMMIGPVQGGALLKTADTGYKELTDLVLPVFLLSGAVLTFDRVARGGTTPLYVGTLAVKVGLAAVMFHLAFRARRGGLSASPLTVRALVGLGAAVVLLAALLKTLYELEGR